MILALHRFWMWLGLPHWYLSTGCLHQDHAYCAGMTGLAGVKRPARCKFCDVPCRCRCHRTARTPHPRSWATRQTEEGTA